MKDPEKFGGTESVGEDVEDIMVEAGQDAPKLEALLELFEKLIELAEPYTNKKTGKIITPNNRIPVEKLPLELINKINTIDGAFVESMSYTEWMQVLLKSKQRIKEKLESISSFKSDLK